MNIFSEAFQAIAFVLAGIFVGIAVGIYIRKRFTEIHQKNIERLLRKEENKATFLLSKKKREAERLRQSA